jgi:hypothetical protein
LFVALENSNAIAEWLKVIPNSFIHYGDFDPKGIHAYLHNSTQPTFPAMSIFGFFIIAGILAYIYRTYFYNSTYETKDERYNAERARKQRELDKLLDKINKRGMDSLSESERRRLDELSGKR